MTTAQPLKKLPVVVKTKKKKNYDCHVALVISLLINLFFTFIFFEHFLEWVIKTLKGML